MKKHIIEKTNSIVSKFPEPQLETCYLMFCPETSEFFLDITPADTGAIAAALLDALKNNKNPGEAISAKHLLTTKDINFAFRAQHRPEGFCKLADKLKGITDKEWVVIQCITTVVPRRLYLSKSENK